MSEKIFKQTAFSFSPDVQMQRQDFMVSKCNAEAYGFIDMWPEWITNGLVIYGPKGSGKTHLCHLFADKVNSEKTLPQKVPFYDCGQITLKNVERICNASEIIILENLREKVNEEALFHVFNHFNQQGRYMLWTALNAPARIPFKIKDLQSRLDMLPAIEIKEPDDIMLRALVIKLFGDRQLIISPEILEYIINNTERSFAFIEKLVQEIDEISLAYKTTINYKVVKEAIENLRNNEMREPNLFNF